MISFRKSAGILAAALAIPLTVAGTAHAAIPFDKTVNGKASYFTDKGRGACGDKIDATAELLVAVPKSYWTGGNPNNDPVCKNVYVEVSYKGKKLTLRVKDQCPECSSTKIDLSRAAFAKLDEISEGIIKVSWKFVRG